MTDRRLYYTVAPGTKAAKAIAEFQRLHRTAAKAAFKLLESLGVPKEFNVVVLSGRVAGVTSKPFQQAREWLKQNGTAWRSDGADHCGHPYLHPRCNTPEGRAIRKQLGALPAAPSVRTLERLLFGLEENRVRFDGLSLVSTSLERIGKHTIVGVPWVIVRDNLAGRAHQLGLDSLHPATYFKLEDEQAEREAKQRKRREVALVRAAKREEDRLAETAAGRP